MTALLEVSGLRKHFTVVKGFPRPVRSTEDPTRAPARSIDSGTSGLGVLVTLGNCPSGAICSTTGSTRKPWARRTSSEVIEPTPCSGVKTTLKSSVRGGGTRLCSRHSLT